MTDTIKSAYLEEIRTQCQYAINAANFMYMALVAYNEQGKETQQSINFDEVFRNLHSFLNHSSNVSKLIWAPANPQHETPEQIARREFLTSEYGVRPDNILAKRKLRNNLEHYDERLDAWSKEGHGFIIPDAILDPTIHEVKGFDLKDIMRWYNPGAAEFSFRGEAFSIQEILTAINELKEKSEQLLSKPWYTEGGALIQTTKRMQRRGE